MRILAALILRSILQVLAFLAFIAASFAVVFWLVTTITPPVTP